MDIIKNLEIKNGMLVILPAHPNLRGEKTKIVSITEKGTELKNKHLKLYLGRYGLSFMDKEEVMVSTFIGQTYGWPDIEGEVSIVKENTYFLEGYGEIEFIPINYKNSIINEIRIILDGKDFYPLKNLEMLVPNDVKYMSHSIKNDPGAMCDQRVIYRIEDNGRYKKYVMPGVKTEGSGKYVVPVDKAIQCSSNLDTICYTDNLDLIIKQYFPEGSGPEIKRILEVSE